MVLVIKDTFKVKTYTMPTESLMVLKVFPNLAVRQEH